MLVVLHFSAFGSVCVCVSVCVMGRFRGRVCDRHWTGLGDGLVCVCRVSEGTEFTVFTV